MKNSSISPSVISGSFAIIIAFLFLIYGFSKLARYRDFMNTGFDVLIDVVIMGFFFLFLIIGTKDIFMGIKNQ